MKISLWERIKYTLDIERPSDVFIYVGFLIIVLAFLACWCTILAQVFATNPFLGAFLSITTVGFIFLFIGLGLYEKGY